jgi:hypothetical protein
MSGMGHVDKIERVTEEGVPGVEITGDPAGGALGSLEHYQPAGDDALPLPGDTYASADGGGTGGEQAVGYNDSKNAGKAAPGEKRIYGRSPSGEVVCEFWLKGDSSIRCSNANGYFEFGADGTFKVNGFEVDKLGNAKSPLEITAMAASPATSVTTSKHMVPSPFGPLGPPIPGT